MSTSVSTNGKSAHVNPLPEHEFDQRFKPLAEQWRAQDKKGLETRFDLGKLLNEHIGAFNTRATRGKEVVAKVCLELKITKSDVSRARHFAHAFESIADFVERHPGVTTWGGVKVLLPMLKKQGKGQGNATEAASAAGAMKDPTPRKMERHLKGFSDEFLHVQSYLSVEELDSLKRRIGGILEQVQVYHFQRSSVLAAGKFADSNPWSTRGSGNGGDGPPA